MISVWLLIVIGCSGLIILFEGKMGSGKSLTSTAYSIMELVYNDRAIISNSSIFLPILKNPDTDEELEMYVIEEPFGDGKRIIESGYIVDGERIKRYERLNYEKLVSWMENNTVLYDATIVLDEAYLYSDSRLSSSAFNRLTSYLYLQTRKRRLDLYVNSQQYENVDIRLRRNIDMRFICSFDNYSKYVTFKIIDIKTGKRSRRKMLYGPDWFPFFDTEEIPDLRPSHTKVTL